MYEILIAKSVALNAKRTGGVIADINEVNQLAEGAIAVFSVDGVLINVAGGPPTVADSLTDKKGIMIAVGGASDEEGAKLSRVIPRVDINYTAKGYSAPVLQKSFIGSDGTIGALNNPAIVAGQIAFIRIVDNTALQIQPNQAKRYEYVTKTGDTIATILTALVNKINNDSTSIVTAAIIGANVGISLTAKEVGTIFETGVQGEVLEHATVLEPWDTTPGDAVGMFEGEGTSDIIAALENDRSTYEGNTNRINLPQKWFSKGFVTVAGTNYLQYVFTWCQGNSTPIKAQLGVNHETIVAMPVAATQKGDFEKIMAEAFGKSNEAEAGADVA